MAATSPAVLHSSRDLGILIRRLFHFASKFYHHLEQMVCLSALKSWLGELSSCWWCADWWSILVFGLVLQVKSQVFSLSMRWDCFLFFGLEISFAQIFLGRLQQPCSETTTQSFDFLNVIYLSKFFFQSLKCLNDFFDYFF